MSAIDLVAAARGTT